MCGPYRFHHHDCLVVPTHTVADHSNFHWEKVSLLVEYEPLGKPLFRDPPTVTPSRGNTMPDLSAGSDLCLHRPHLQAYCTLRTVLDLTTSHLSLSAGSACIPSHPMQEAGGGGGDVCSVRKPPSKAFHIYKPL